MLFVLFQLGNDRYALEASQVVEVIPFVTLKKLPQAPKGIAGYFIYRGQPVPAVDLGDLWFGKPARDRLSTRIIVVNDAGSPRETPPRSEVRSQKSEVRLPTSDLRPPSAGRLGLIAERATATMKSEAGEFKELGVPLAPWDKHPPSAQRGAGQSYPTGQAATAGQEKAESRKQKAEIPISPFSFSAFQLFSFSEGGEQGVLQLIQPRQLSGLLAEVSERQNDK